MGDRRSSTTGLARARAVLTSLVVLGAACGSENSSGRSEPEVVDGTPTSSIDTSSSLTVPPPSAELPVSSSAAPGPTVEARERCLNCVGALPEGVAAQLSYFTGGGSGPNCGIINEIRGLDDDEFYVGLRGDEAAAGGHQWFCIHGVDHDLPLTITIERPDGAVVEMRWVGGARRDRVVTLGVAGSIEVGNPFGALLLVLTPGLPLGDYRVTAIATASEATIPPQDGTAPAAEPSGLRSDHGSGQRVPPSTPPETTPGVPDASLAPEDTTTGSSEPEQSPPTSGAGPGPEPTATGGADTTPPAALSSVSTFHLGAGSAPRVETSPPARFYGEGTGVGGTAPGGSVTFLLSGFPPQSTVEPLLYFHTEDRPCGGWYCFATSLPPVVVDGDGAAVYELPTTVTDPEGLFCVTTTATDSCSSETGFSGEFFIGEPFVY